MATPTSTVDPWSGHFGHLDKKQQTALDAFKVKLQGEQLWTPAPNGAHPREASHDEGTLLRFLRARRFVVDDAVVQFRDTEAWRARNKLDQLYEKIDVHDYDETRKLYPQWTGRRDKRGIPVYVFRVADLDSKTIAAHLARVGEPIPVDESPPPSEATSGTSTPNGTGPEPKRQHKNNSSGSGSSFLKAASWLGGSSNKNDNTSGLSATSTDPTPARMLRLFSIYENLTRFVMPLCNVAPRPNPEVPITQSNNIVDVSNVGLRQFWNLRNHMQDASTLSTAHYPETLDRIFVIGAPSFFPTVWGWIQKWFDPITTSKVFILPNGTAEVYATLSKYIDHDNIPTQYGGGLVFEFGDLPSLEPELAALMKWEEGAVVRAPSSGRSSSDSANSKEKKQSEKGEQAATEDNAVLREQELTTPIGPIYWERQETTTPSPDSPPASNGVTPPTATWRAVAIGSRKGVTRHQDVATLTPPPGKGLEDSVFVSRAQLGSGSVNGSKIL